ncbi:glycosyltransferase family 4 protein [filamentous cyanobacterium LEGE 11480]|uniref:Glycosyltransferase family 4 protein n=1 Tax=Romeriopsis navalis LEGE 11480 TaxID=2777977 RepID=A0A928Z6A8_9CYAN|nr:glycosyltransferase [Romeriopsis navalis]MBE9032837.1 glycosyltransferase family 4 protein [Romeriopsis navalis LEGE 11480]
MRINYFSPLLPSQSGISEVAEQVVPALSQYATVTVWTDQTEWSQALAQSAKIRQYDPNDVSWRELNDTDLNVYHIGNNVHFHHGIWQISNRVPGLVVVHDVKLQHLFYGITCVRGRDGEGYIREISRRYGHEAGITARRFLSGEVPIAAVEDFSMTEWALENAAAVMVHTRTAFQQIAQADRWPVGYQPLAFHTPPILRERPRQAPPYRLVIFGYIAYNRRVEAVLEALGKFAQRRKFQLDIYGKLDDPDSINGCIQQFNLKAQVKVHGFVDDAVLDRALSEAHLAINLRYPTMGEASISQLRIWRHALPALVTQVGWYAEQPEDIVCFVRPEHEVEDIQQHLAALIKQPEHFRAMGQRGRQRLESMHSPDAYAQAIVRFAAQLKPGYQNLTTQYWLEQVAGIMAPWQAGELSDRDLDRVTQTISWLSHPTNQPGNIDSITSTKKSPR